MSKSETQPHARKLCGAKTRKGNPCRNHAMTNGKCRMHGGKSTGAPKNNKNGLVTGERESIIFDYLDDEEKDLLKEIDLNKLNQIDNDIKLIDIRLRRMMGRIAKLQQEDMTTVKTTLKKDEFGEEFEEVKQDTLSQIQNIEEAITRVQSQKLRLIKVKHELEMDLGINLEVKEAELKEIKAKIDGTYGADTSDNRTIHITNNIPNAIGDNDEE